MIHKQTSERVYLNGIMYACSISMPIQVLLNVQRRDIITNNNNGTFTITQSGYYSVNSYGKQLQVVRVGGIPDIYLDWTDKLVVL